MTVYLKALRAGRVSPYQGVTWAEPGTWMQVDGPLRLCENGLHLCRPEQIVHWLREELWVVEVDESSDVLVHETQVVVRRARLVRRLAEWDERTARLFAADCAERVLPIWEASYPHDDRPRRAIEAARSYARGEIGAAAADAARAAAWAAAGDAAWDAAWAAARAAARAAAGDAAADAARAAAGDAEIAWQTDHLLALLNLTEEATR